MLRRILAPLSSTQLNDSTVSEAADNCADDSVVVDTGAAAAAGDGCVYRREPVVPGLRDVTVGAPQNFRLRAHVACDPDTGLYTGMDEFLTLAVSSKDRRLSSAPASMNDADEAFPVSIFDTAAAVASAVPQSAQFDGITDKTKARRIGVSQGVVAASFDAVGVKTAKSSSVTAAGRGHRRGGVQVSTGASLAEPSSPGPHSTASMRRPPKLPSSSIVSGVPTGKSPPKRKSPRKVIGNGLAFSRNVFAKPSMPTAVTHAVHVRLDPSNPTGFAGLPPAWENILLYSGIAKDDALQHPQELVDVLNFSKVPGLDTSNEYAVASRSDGYGVDGGDLPPICFSFPRTPTVTSFDDASEHAVELPYFAENNDASSSIQVKELATNTGLSRTDKYIAGPLAWHRGGARKSSQSRGSATETHPDAPALADKENHPQILWPQSQSSVGGLAALASRCGANAALLVPSDASRLSKSEAEMQKIIGGDRLSHLPDCLPRDAITLEIREDCLRALYTEIVKIGEGSSGSVYSAVRSSDGKLVAIKQVKPANEHDWALYRYEVHVMKSHGTQENLVSCYDAFRESDYLYMVLELMSASLADVLERRRAGAFNRALQSSNNSVGRELSFSGIVDVNPPTDGTSRIAKRKKSKASTLSMATGFEENFIAHICREVLRGLEQVHLISRVHRDIKSDNILVRPDGAVKVADFGFCAELEAGARNTVVGTPYQMAPEVIRGRNYGTAVDIWSTGVLAYELAEGAPPHEGLAPIRAMFQIATSGPPSLGEAWSPELRDFVAACCQIDPSSRPSASDALKHPFLVQACTKQQAGVVFASLCVPSEQLGSAFQS
jgi:serine/threonine protein kinase